MFNIPSRADIRSQPLRSDRLVLRPVDVSDAQPLWHAVESSRAWLQPWLPWVPYNNTVEASVQFVKNCAIDWDQGRALRLTIRERDHGPLLGVVGLEACVGMHRACDLGYWLGKDSTGRGWMTEAAHRCLDFGFRQVGMHRIRVAAATDNHPSLRVIGRLGFRLEGFARQAEWCDGRWLDHAVYALLEPEWRDRPPVHSGRSR